VRSVGVASRLTSECECFCKIKSDKNDMTTRRLVMKADVLDEFWNSNGYFFPTPTRICQAGLHRFSFLSKMTDLSTDSVYTLNDFSRCATF
jgi:hypothetical protein